MPRLSKIQGLVIPNRDVQNMPTSCSHFAIPKHQLRQPRGPVQEPNVGLISYWLKTSMTWILQDRLPGYIMMLEYSDL